MTFRHLMERRGRGPSTKRAASAASAAAAREPEPRRRSPASPTWQRQKRKPSDGIFVFMAVFFFSLFFLARGLLFFAKLENLFLFYRVLRRSTKFSRKKPGNFYSILF